ncbi:DUF4177 domain-containing protein [Aerolutibacter ruishenii]|uniref:Uncharacterized protein DUF4177 n=1 Tax=Aerolutibacter ruishenii TaxID=686800 RepID=A0A562LI70_9GAMM|nr:DUF4177 domain-containing protein [Lysobacter ruishenii]TWI07334.1 uncharacterized protein DUF4177 [Lysobacter ruishenii]
MNQRWQYHVVDLPPRMFETMPERLQAELDRLGAEGWELVSVVQVPTLTDYARLFFKQPA